MSNDTIIKDAEFNDAVTTYWLLNGILLCIVTVIGLVALPFWIIIGKFFTRKYLASHRCTLTDKSLKVSKGIFTKIEKTVPLDRITDLGIVQGPIMRYFDIEALSVETAGNSSGSSLVQLTGIKDGRAFRDLVLAQRDTVTLANSGPSDSVTVASAVTSNDQTVQLLTEIRDTMRNIENKLDNQS
ncbi:PH domain-containing protein [Mariniblastus fucicola]|nr:PH domain-containing protein [Mariniblastus fucicola]